MSIVKELHINITMSNYTTRSSSYSSKYDYILLDSIDTSQYSNLFRSDLKNLKILDENSSELQVLYIPPYSSQKACMLVKIPVNIISQTTSLILLVYDTSTVFSNTLSVGGDVSFFDANSDTYSNFFKDYSGLSSNYDATDKGKYLRAKFVPSPNGSSPTCLITKSLSGGALKDNRVTVARFKRIGGNLYVNDNATYNGTTQGCVMLQSDFNLTEYGVDMQMTTLNLGGGRKNYCMFDGEATLVQSMSFDAYNEGSDDDEYYMQCHLHARAGNGFSASADYLEVFFRDNPTMLHDQNFNEVEISASGYADSTLTDFNYVDLKLLLVFPSPLFAANGIPIIEVVEKKTKTGIRMYKGRYEYTKAYRGNILLWNANDENLDNTGLHLPKKITDKKWDWVF